MNQPHPLFPITLDTSWQPPVGFSLNENLLSWLLDPSSLTARLSQCCKRFSVEVLGQEIQSCSIAESTSDIHAAEQVLVREVLLYCDDVPQVFARSILPLKSLTGEEQQLAHLGNQSLGQVLFSNKNLYRKSIEISAFSHSSAVSRLARQLELPTQTELWGRRSTFILHDKPLMVAEVFLPNAFAYQSAVLQTTKSIQEET